MASSESDNKDELAAPEQWVETYGDVLYYYALQRLRNAELAEDLVQETFLAALKNRQQFTGQSTARTWLVGILRHKIVDYYRSQNLQLTIENETQQHQACENFFDRRHHWLHPPRHWQSDPAEQFQWQEFWEVFQDCLSKLPTILANTFKMREMEEQTSEDVCKVLDITPTNLWIRLHRARLSLRECLQTQWYQDKDRSK